MATELCKIAPVYQREVLSFLGENTTIGFHGSMTWLIGVENSPLLPSPSRFENRSVRFVLFFSGSAFEI